MVKARSGRHSNYLNRPQVLKELLKWRNTPEIKVIVGVRRCGKSTALYMLADALRADGVPESNLFYRRFDAFGTPLDYDVNALYGELQKALDGADGRWPLTVMLDEIQDVTGWEKVVRRLHTQENVDVYITGSNASLLSSDLATYLTGRYVEIPMYPLSFKEYWDFCNAVGSPIETSNDAPKTADDPLDAIFVSAGSRHTRHDRQDVFNDYLRTGGMPSLFALKTQVQGSKAISDELQGIYESIVFKDVAQRGDVRDLAALEKVSRFLFSTSGSLFSSRKVLGALASVGHKISATALNNYITGLERAFLIYRAEQSAVQGKAILRPMNKYYPVDVGFRNLATGFSGNDVGARLECVVYLELRRRGYLVTVGSRDKAEIDFVATRGVSDRSDRMYVQVTASMLEESTRARELAPLEGLTDAFPRIVITLDPYTAGTDENGIQIVNALDWLME